MNWKKIAAWVVFVIGLILVIFSLYAKMRIAAAKGKVNGVTNLLSNSRVDQAVGKEITKAASKYDGLVLICLTSGIALTAIGGGILISRRRRR